MVSQQTQCEQVWSCKQEGKLSGWSVGEYPSVERDLFIFAASLRRSPSAPEIFCLNK